MKKNWLIRLGKKADFGTEEVLEQFPNIMLTAVVLAAIFLLVNYYVNLSIDSRPVQAEVLFGRLMYSPNSIMYMDDVTGVVYPGVIDLERFTDDVLDSSIKYRGERHISAKLDLYDAKMGLVKIAYLNKVGYNRLEPIVTSNIGGASSGKKYYQSIPIIYRINNVNQPGFLNITILMPN